MRTLYVSAETGEDIAKLLKKHGGRGQLIAIAEAIEVMCAQAGEDGYFVMTGQRFKKKRKAWTERETQKFVRMLEGYRSSDQWERGKRKIAWALMGEEMGRDPGSLKTKYMELVRKGIIKDDNT